MSGTEPHEGPVVESQHGSPPTTAELQLVVADLKQRFHKLEAEGLNKSLRGKLGKTIQELEGALETVLNDPEIDEFSESELS